MEKCTQNLLTTVPAYAHYLTWLEISGQIEALRHQPGFTVETLGHTVEGRPIEMIRYDTKAERTVLLWGFEDPTEPVCALSMFWLCEQLRLRNPHLQRFNCNWAMIPTINPDGVVRNEAWLHAPGDLRAFLRGAWEPPYEQVLYWYPVWTCAEMTALRLAITTLKPDVLFDMHDESHFPAPGYQVFLSSSLPSPALQSHLAYAKSLGMPMVDPPIADVAWLHDPQMSVAPAYMVNPNCLVLLDEVCGYATCEPKDERSSAFPNTTKVLDVISRYLATLDRLQDIDPILLDSAKSHTRRAATHIAAGINAAKALAVGGCGLRVLRCHGAAQDADAFEEHFWQYISAQHPAGTVKIIPIQHQVQAQLSCLFTVLNARHYWQ